MPEATPCPFSRSFRDDAHLKEQFHHVDIKIKIELEQNEKYSSTRFIDIFQAFDKVSHLQN